MSTIVNLDPIPANFRCIARSWYTWQEITLRGMGRAPGDQSSDVSSYDYWNDVPPAMSQERELRMGSSPATFVAQLPDEYSIDIEERGIRSNGVQRFRELDDVNKLMLWKFANSARMVGTFENLDLKWYQEGTDPSVILRRDPSSPGWASITVAGDPVQRGWMSDTAAVSFSHAIVMSYSELDGKLREGIPSDWFTVTFSE